MTTAELIAKLKSADPDGVREVADLGQRTRS
jgi:hypothetical protein